MPEIYDSGDIVRLPVSFATADGLPSDPNTVELKVTQPNGLVGSYTWAAAQVMRDAVGQFHYDLDLTGAAPGVWEFLWIATGAPTLTEGGYFTVRTHALSELVRDIRRSVRDYPQLTWVGDDPTLAANALEITLPVGGAAPFSTPGVTIEFDDVSAERAITTAAADTTTLKVPVRRGQDGTSAYPHDKDTPILIQPRWAKSEIISVLTDICDDELWPQVWVTGEFQLNYQASNEYYPAPVPDIGAVVGAYQINAGLLYATHVEFLPPPIADNTHFPYGALLIRRPWDSTKIYVSYRAMPTIGTLNGGLRSLAIMGATAQLLMQEEGVHVGPGASAIDKRVTDGSKLRAGATMWQRFERKRTQVSIALESREGAVRSRFVRSVL